MTVLAGLLPPPHNFGFGYMQCWRPLSYQYLWPDPLELCYIIPFWHLLSNFNEMTQANKLSLNFPSLCPLVSSFINWTANVVLIFSFLQLNLKWPRLLVVYGLELLFLDISIHSMTSFLFFFLSCGDEWTRHTISRRPRSWQWRHGLQVSVAFRLNFLKRKFSKSFSLRCAVWWWMAFADIWWKTLKYNICNLGFSRNSLFHICLPDLSKYWFLGAMRTGVFLLSS